MNLSKNFLIRTLYCLTLFYIQLLMGQQFKKNCLGLSCFGIQVIIPCLLHVVEDNSPISFDLFIVSITKYYF